jgi:hypothetical protein
MMGAMAAAFAMTATAAMAQDVAFEEKKQAVIKNAKEPEKAQRTTLEQEEGAGPKVDFETDVWNNYRLVIDNTSFDSTKKTASAELFVNGASVGKVVLYDSYTNSNAMLSIWLRGGNEGLVVCYDNIFVGYRNSSEE